MVVVDLVAGCLSEMDGYWENGKRLCSNKLKKVGREWLCWLLGVERRDGNTGEGFFWGHQGGSDVGGTGRILEVETLFKSLSRRESFRASR